MGIIISTIFPTKNQNPKHLNRPRSTSPTKSMISHPYPLGTQMLTTSAPTSLEIHAKDQNGKSSRFGRGRRSIHRLHRGLSSRNSQNIDETAEEEGDDNVDPDGFRRLLSPSPPTTLLDVNEEDSQGQQLLAINDQIQNRIIQPENITVNDNHDNRNKLKKVVTVEGDWDLIRSSDLDGI